MKLIEHFLAFDEGERARDHVGFVETGEEPFVVFLSFVLDLGVDELELFCLDSSHFLSSRVYSVTVE